MVLSIFFSFKSDTELNALSRCIFNSYEMNNFFDPDFLSAMFGWILLIAFGSFITLHKSHKVLINTRIRQFRSLSENPFKRRETGCQSYLTL